MGVIVTVRQGFRMPQALFDILSKRYPTALDIGVQTAGLVVKRSLHSDKDWNVAFQNLCKGSVTTVFHFHKYEKERKIEDVQPFVVVNDDDGSAHAKVVAFLSGEWSNPKLKLDKDSPFSRETLVYNAYLKNALSAAYDEVGGELPKFFQTICTNEFRKKLKPLLAPRGVILLMPGEGELAQFSENMFVQDGPSKEYEWGTCTNPHNYAEPSLSAQGPTKVVSNGDKPPLSLPPKKPSLDDLSDDEATPETVPDKTVETKTGATTSVPIAGGEQELMIPGFNSMSHKQMKDCQVLNLKQEKRFKHGWKDRASYPVSHFMDTSPILRAAIASGAIRAKSFEEAKAQLDAKPERETKDTPVKKEGPQVTDKPVPVMSPTAVEHTANLIKTGVLQMMDAKQFAASVEGSLDLFSKRMTVSPNLPLFYSYEGIKKMHPEACAILCLELILRIRDEHPEIVAEFEKKMATGGETPEQKAKREKLEALQAQIAALQAA